MLSSVELIDSMGGDLSIVNAARVSFHKRGELVWHCTQTGEDDLPDERVCVDCVRALSVRDAGLIRYLAKNRHGTPFEMVQLQFRVRCPIGVAREWMRHRIGSFNEESTRYVEMRPDFYVPEGAALRGQVGKPGAYSFEPLATETADAAAREMRDAYASAYQTYRRLLGLGLAREVARNVLPLGLLTEFVWSVNLRSLFNFLSLRTAPAALLEIRQLAEEVETLAEQVAPVALAAWREGGRVPL